MYGLLFLVLAMASLLSLSQDVNAQYIATPFFMPIVLEDLQPITAANAHEIIKLGELKYYDDVSERQSIYSVAISADGSMLAAGGEAGIVTLWDVRTGVVLRILQVRNAVNNGGGSDNVWCVALSSDGQLLATLGEAGIGLWNVNSGEQTSTLSGNCGVTMNGVQFSSDNQFLYFLNDKKELQIWDIAKHSELISMDFGNSVSMGSIGLSLDNQRIAAGTFNFRGAVWDVLSGTRIFDLPFEASTPSQVSLNFDGTKMLVGYMDGTVKLWNVTSRAEVQMLHQYTSYVAGVGFSSDGTIAVATSRDDTRLSMWDVSNGGTITLLNENFQTYDLAFSNNGKLLVTASPFDGVHLYGIPRCAVRAPIDVNLREGSGTNYEAALVFPANQLGFVDGGWKDASGFDWWHLTNNLWVRADTVDELGSDCEGIAIMEN